MAEQLSSTTVPAWPRVDKVVQDADIPVVDLANPDRAAVVAQIRAAFDSHGFFQVLNHGLPAEIVLVARSQSLGLEQDYIKKVLGEQEQHMAANFYPKCPSPDLTYGLPAHTDPNALTIVMMDEQVAGLQVLKECRWIAVNPRPNAFVINLGDQLQAAARGGAAGGDVAVGAEAGGAARVSAAARMMSAVANVTSAVVAVFKCASASADE